LSNETKETFESEDTKSEQHPSRLSRDYGKLKPKPKKEGGIYKLIDNVFIIAIIGACVTIIPAIGMPIDLIAIICGVIAMKRDPHDRSAKFAVIIGSIFFVAGAGFIIAILVMVWDL